MLPKSVGLAQQSSAYSDRERVGGVGRGDYQVSGTGKAEANGVGDGGEDLSGFAAFCYTDHAVAALITGGAEKISLRIEGEPLRAGVTLEIRTNTACFSVRPNAVVARQAGRSNIQPSVGTEG